MRNTFTIILDEESTKFLDQKAGGDPNGYINRLLEKEKARQAQSGKQGQKLQNLLDSTPNAST